MAGGAKVTALEAMDAFAAALRVFHDEATRSLENVDMGLRGAVDWVRLDRKNYWRRQLQLGEQRMHEARLDLQRAQAFRRVDDHRPACIEEVRELNRAQRRMKLCQRQLDAVGHWTRVVDRAVCEYDGGASQLARWLETDVELAIAAIGRLRRILDAYVATAKTADAPAPYSQAVNPSPASAGLPANLEQDSPPSEDTTNHAKRSRQ